MLLFALRLVVCMIHACVCHAAFWQLLSSCARKIRGSLAAVLLAIPSAPPYRP